MLKLIRYFYALPDASLSTMHWLSLHVFGLEHLGKALQTLVSIKWEWNPGPSCSESAVSLTFTEGLMEALEFPGYDAVSASEVGPRRGVVVPQIGLGIEPSVRLLHRCHCLPSSLFVLHPGDVSLSPPPAPPHLYPRPGFLSARGLIFFYHFISRGTGNGSWIRA